MKQRIFDILKQINQECLDNCQWTITELYEQNTKDYFGTKEDLIIEGKVLAIWVDANDSFSFIRTETADEMLTIPNDTPFPTALMLWYL